MKTIHLIKCLLDAVREDADVVVYDRDSDRTFTIQTCTRKKDNGQVSFELHIGKSLVEALQAEIEK